MQIQLNTEHGLFRKLVDESPKWWNNLKSDPDIYIDVRKGNSLNAYHNGGSIMRLKGAKAFKAEIHVEYIPVSRATNYQSFSFNNGDVFLDELRTMAIKNFESDSLAKIKKRIQKFYPNDSEKGIQGRYVVTANRNPKGTGFFIDTEMQYKKGRIDLVWLDLKNKKIAFVELKTIGDERLYIEKSQKQETIDLQLSKYRDFTRENRDALIGYYDKVYRIKKRLGLLPGFAKEKSIQSFDIIEKPILLIGDCTQDWINRNAEELNSQLKDIAFGCLYQGKSTNDFRIPYKPSRYGFNFDQL